MRFKKKMTSLAISFILCYFCLQGMAHMVLNFLSSGPAMSMIYTELNQVLDKVFGT